MSAAASSATTTTLPSSGWNASFDICSLRSLLRSAESRRHHPGPAPGRIEPPDRRPIVGERLPVEGVLAVALLISAVWLSPRLAFWALIVLPVGLFPIGPIAKRTLARSHQVRRTGYVLFDMILQILRGIRVIKVYQGEGRE